MHGEHRGGPQLGKGIPQQEKLTPELAAVAAAGQLGPAPQIRQHRLQPLAAITAGGGGQPQLQLGFASFHRHPQGFDHRGIGDAQLGQVTAVGGDIAHQ